LSVNVLRSLKFSELFSCTRTLSISRRAEETAERVGSTILTHDLGHFTWRGYKQSGFGVACVTVGIIAGIMDTTR
jgi:hypothetical protein